MNSINASKKKGGYYYIDNAAGTHKWHLRFGVTPNCNFRCSYCAPNDGFIKRDQIPYSEACSILEAAYKNNISRVHWTGGEPTLRHDFIELLLAAKNIGYTQQVVTTNGFRLNDILDECIENGLSRVIVSLDTLNEKRFEELTENKCFCNVVSLVEKSVLKLASPTKVSCCTMRSTLPELKGFIEWAHGLNCESTNKGRMILKLNQFFPSNPAQLEELGEKYWASEFVCEEEILKHLSEIGELIPVARASVIGDNPTYDYYEIKGYNVQIGVLAMFSKGYPCGGCHKLRVKPNGAVSVCMDFPNSDENLLGLSVDDKSKKIKKAMAFREDELELLKPCRTHFNGSLGSQRFGETDEKKPLSHFYDKLRK